jgi:Na+/pantothenate symporter
MGDASASAGYGTLLMLLLMIAASVWLGTLAQRVVERGSFMKGYFLGNRGLGSWALALTATVQSGGTFMGFPSFVYSNGWVVALWISSYMVVPLTGFAVLAKRFAQLSRRTGAITVPDLFRERFGDPRVGLVASLLILFIMTFMMVAQFKAGAIIMKNAWPDSGVLALSEDAAPLRISTGAIEDLRKHGVPDEVLAKLTPLVGAGFDAPRALEDELDIVLGPQEAVYKQQIITASQQIDWLYYTGLAVFTLTVVGYTLIGGFLAAVWTDLFQSVLMWVGVMLLLPLAIVAAGGLPAASERLRHEVIAKPGTPSVAEVKQESQRLAPVVERLEALDAALREYAARHDGRLPDGLHELSVGPPDSESQATAQMAWDQEPILQEHQARYFGRGQRIDEPGATQRVPLVVTKANERQWRAVLYSNGTIKTGQFSEPGALTTGPGPFGWLPLGLAISFFFQWAFAGMGSPASMVRVMACRDTATVRRSIFLLGTYNMFIYIPLILICICAHSVLPDLAPRESDEVIPRLALLTTGGFWGGSLVSGLILAAPFGAVMATVSSYLVVIASGLVRDVYQRFMNPQATAHELKRLAYVVMVVVGAIGLASNIRPIDYLQKIVVFSGTCGAVTFVAPAIMAAFWRRATAAGAMAAMLGGVGVNVVLYATGLIMTHEFKPYPLLGIDPIIWGMGTSATAGIVVSLCTSRPDAQLVARLFDAPATEASACAGPVLGT